LDDIAVGFGEAQLVLHVPAQGLEERVEEVLADLRLIVSTRETLIPVALETLDQVENGRGR
jgi:hypothetical protein